MSAADLRLMIERASRHVEGIFQATGHILPMWHAIKSNGKHIIMPAPETDDKDTAAAIMRALFELEDVVCCLFIDEAWIIEAHNAGDARKLNEWIAQGHGARDHPNRYEVVVFAAEDANSMLTARRPIIRPAHGKPKLGPLQIDDMRGVQSSGRMVGMLPRRATVQ
jgi:hypothetical protein